MESDVNMGIYATLIVTLSLSFDYSTLDVELVVELSYTGVVKTV
jgi:hypothetical protein